ncbi:uncharacterized protein BX664DRAFT_344339 [Halteromyces radiatus]|uniref:uncharacterized protein n=1 Tax=Halteromyces radiatus TaxID=101107 RepID=UPI0022203366|nr:uncharacterized protein BX664DRAFT_344339 [Halteromyces radiatus]KAI8076316.1 hypothetical protein BX664DRAFT_344339 [Halteromyces radiatus]
MISAYVLDGSSRAFSSVRMSLAEIRPVLSVDDNERIVRSPARRLAVEGFQRNPRKVEFLVKKYIFENWEDKEKVSASGVSKERFGTELGELYLRLGKYKLRYIR